jgi:hypothetical protein
MALIYIQPMVALIAGILILIQPRLLNYIVAIYLNHCRRCGPDASLTGVMPLPLGLIFLPKLENVII